MTYNIVRSLPMDSFDLLLSKQNEKIIEINRKKDE